MQIIDPEISKSKFDAEIQAFLKVRDMNRERGILLIEREFPNAFFAFGSPKLKPCPIVFAVKINFDNYDLEPLSLQFIDPFSFQPIKLQDVSTHFYRNIEQNGAFTPQPLLQQESLPESLPFLCIPGVREYHKHPAHTGDSWLLHRKVAGEGSLGFVVEKLYDYGISPISSYQIQLPPFFNTTHLPLGINPSIVPK